MTKEKALEIIERLYKSNGGEFDEAQELAWEHCQENSGNFADWANVEKVEEIE